jgi:hypothetical protein
MVWNGRTVLAAFREAKKQPVEIDDEVARMENEK